MLSALLGATCAIAQHVHTPSMNMVDMNAASMDLMNMASGTAVNPASWNMPMLMRPFGHWNTDFMATGFLVDTQQSGPRGGDKLFSTNWFMASAEHRAGENGALQLDLMLSLDPATITGRRYPLLFQTGETAFGRPLTDAQHPHDFLMGLGLHYLRSVGRDTTLHLYFAPVGDPALGPVAFSHRASAMELPESPISHHWQDSTHIANEVVTVGITHRKVRVEASGFYGSEPDENRWNIDSGPINSWSARLWYFPNRNWAVQVSGGKLAHPEAREPGDIVRTTASVAYNKPVAGGAWSSTFVWGQNYSTESRRYLNSYLAETVLPLRRKNFFSGRVEFADKDELFAGRPRTPEGAFLIGAYTAGYTRDVAWFRNIEAGIGASFTAYSLAEALKPYYGGRPVGGAVFLRFRLRPAE